MHGCNLGSALLVNADVDSMGGAVDGGVGTGLKTSPRRAAIEKAQAELRQEYDVREERRRELEFLEKGGNPLDFKIGNAASVSVQSTSFTDQHHEQFVTSEAKGSFVLTASPHGDSVDSSARPGAPSVSEPNTADNLLLFDGQSELPEGKRRSLHSNRRNYIAPSEQSSQIDGNQNAKESEDSAIFRPYARRNRSRPNHGLRGGSRDAKGSLSEANNQKDHNMHSVSKPKTAASLNGDIVAKDLTSTIPLSVGLDGVQAHQAISGSTNLEENVNIPIKRNLKEDKWPLPSQGDTVQNSVAMASVEVDVVEARVPTVSADLEPPPFTDVTKLSGLSNGFANIKIDTKSVLGVKNFDSVSSCTQSSLGKDVNNNSDMCTNTENVDANGNTMEQTAVFEKKLNLTCEVLKEKNKTRTGESGSTVNYDHDAGCQNHSELINVVKGEKDVHICSSSMQNKVNDSCKSEGGQQNVNTMSKTDKESDVLVDHCYYNKENSCESVQDAIDVSISEPQSAPAETVKTILAEKVVTAAATDGRPCSGHLKMADKANENSILEEARIIEAKRKRIAELSIRTLPPENHRKIRWGFVLEEMAWLANDFAQERLWKITAAAQLCHRAAFTSRLRLRKENKDWGLKILAHSMAKSVMQFWHTVELLVDNDDPCFNHAGGSVESGNVDANEASWDKRRNSDMMVETSKDFGGQYHRKNVAVKLQEYALRFLKYNGSHGISSQTEALTTPDRISDSCNGDMSWEELLTEENLFYTIPPAATDAYRKSVESHFLQFEKTGSGIQEEVETSFYDTAAEFGSGEIVYDEDEGETSTYHLHGVYEGIKSSKSSQKKHTNLIKHAKKSSDVGADLPYVHYTTGTQPAMLFGRRPGNLNVGPVPTKRKRKRMASRQRVVSPFMITGTMQVEAKTDASSGDTGSFQDDQSTLHGGSQIQKSLEVDSVGDFERQLPYDCTETSVKVKKKKVSAYDQRWQLDSIVLNEQRDLSKKRMDSHHLESNGSSGLYKQHSAKKPKITKQSFDNTFDNISPMTNSIPSPAASQMSNMSNLGKSIKIISGRDRGRKAKNLKISAGQPGSGGLWSLFEDQALVVLVHDLGPNWELISDAINSALHYRSFFRKPKECKDRHKILMDRNAGDGVDSAEDSGSSQSYPSTLPGIPKGSARQLFQRLQGPMEEDTIKSHFEKIIKIGPKQHCHRNQNDIQDLKQITPVHNSHVIALSEVCPNNLTGGLLTPLDLCDINAPPPDTLSLGYQGPHAGGLVLPNQGSATTVLPTSGVNSLLSASSGMVFGNNLPSPSGPATASVRYGVPRTSPLSVDEQQKIPPYNPMSSGRNVQQSGVSVPASLAGSDRSVRMPPGGNGMGVLGGLNRSMAMSRPGFQGMASSSMMSSGSVLSSNMVGIPTPVNMHPGVGSGQGNSMLRPREALHMMRPAHKSEHQRQMVVPEPQMQATQGNSQGNPAFSGLSSAFNNQTTPPPVQPYPRQAQQPHQLSQQQSHLSNLHSHLQGPNHTTNSHQAFALRLAKERQLQQRRYLQHQQQQQQQQQQLAASNPSVPHVQAQSQLPMSSTLSSQVQSQNSSQSVSLPPVTPSSPLTPTSSLNQQQKHNLPQHGFSRSPGASGLNNQAVKQRQRQLQQQQQYQQTSRQHPNQRQHPQSQQQPKLHKGIGKGNMLVQHNMSVDSPHINGPSVPLGSQNTEKGDQIANMMPGQNLYPVSGLNPTQPSKPLGPTYSSNNSQLQQNLHSGPTTTSSKHLQPAVSPSDNSAQRPVPSGHILTPPQASAPQAVLASNNPELTQQPQPQSKKINQTQSDVQRILQQNRLMHSESSIEPQFDLKLDQPPTNNASQISASTTVTQGCIESSGVAPVILNPTTQDSSLGTAPAGNSAGSEPLPTISQGLGPRQLSFSMPSHVHNSGAQWQQQPLSKPSSSQPILSQQPYQPPEQHRQELEHHSPKRVALQDEPQQQLQHLQPGQNSLFACPNSKGE